MLGKLDKCQGRANEQGIHEEVKLVMRQRSICYDQGSGKGGRGVRKESQVRDL